MNEELVARMEAALTEFNDNLEKQVDRITDALGGAQGNKIEQTLQEILEALKLIEMSGNGF